MIKTALVAMTIVGCDCDARLCEYIGETPAKWSTVADCEAAMKSQMLRQSNYDYPLVSGICRTVQKPGTQLAAAPPDAGGDLATGQASAQAVSTEETGSIRRPSVDVGPRQAPAEAVGRGPRVYEAMLDGGRAVLYRTENGYAVVRTGLGATASETVSLAKRSAAWVATKLPSVF